MGYFYSTLELWCSKGAAPGNLIGEDGSMIVTMATFRETGWVRKAAAGYETHMVRTPLDSPN